MDFFTQKSQLNFYYNYLLSKEPVEFNYHVDYLAKVEVRRIKWPTFFRI